MPQTLAAILAFLGGLAPALFWLWFWRKEDTAHPEPRKLVLLAFIAGMIAVPVVLPFQQWAVNAIENQTYVLLVWAFIEEVTKLLIAYALILRKKAIDEPLDPLIYLITVALGFAALENALFIMHPLVSGKVIETLVTGDLRFIGATLIHVLSTAVVGSALAYSFFKSRSSKIVWAMGGVILATVFHALFNILILMTDSGRLLSVFLCVWVGIICLMLSFERIKQMKAPAWWQKAFVRRAE